MEHLLASSFILINVASGSAEITIMDAAEKQLQEPDITDINPDQASVPEKRKRTPRQKGKREDDLKAFSKREIEYKLTGGQLGCGCGSRYTELGKETSVRLIFHPAMFDIEWDVSVADCFKPEHAASYD